MKILLESIRSQLFSLPEDTRVYPGHGPETMIGLEKQTNSFFQ
jgi:glyoxylase-like metal-dependent hydrolase (beta-lactamase superfamily II)